MMLKIGHRGARGYAPENTLASFRKALDLGVDMVELDVHRSADNGLVVIHDDTLERTTNGSGDVADRTVPELQALDAGGGQRIPTLREVLDLVAGKAVLDIELKGLGAGPLVRSLIDEYVASRGRAWGDFLVSSFNHHELWELKQARPRIPVGALAAVLPDGFAAFAHEMGASSVHIASESVTPQRVFDLHQKELKVFVYTVNEPDEMRRLSALGVDGIISDYPDRIP